MKKLLTLAVAICCTLAAVAQTKSDLFKGDAPVTFLGLDFTQTKFIGNAAQWKDAGEITNNAMKEKYIPAWNNMFTDEKEKKNFKVADAVNRTDVGYATEVTEKANKNISKNFFSDNMSDYPSLDEQKIASLVKKYDFMGKTGIGLIFFVEGMRKGEGKDDPSYATIWVTFVDMKSKAVIFTVKDQGKAGGFGFRNFWAGAWKTVIKDVKEHWSSWKKNA